MSTEPTSEEIREVLKKAEEKPRQYSIRDLAKKKGVPWTSEYGHAEGCNVGRDA
jgi:hypothetical protein